MEDPESSPFQSQLHQKRQNSTSMEFYNQNLVKRRLGDQRGGVYSAKDTALSNGDTQVGTVPLMYPMVQLVDQVNGRSRDGVLPASCFLDSGEGIDTSPAKHATEATSPEHHLKVTPQPQSDFTPQSPYYLPTTLSSNMEAAVKAIDNNSVKQVSGMTLQDSRFPLQSKVSQSSLTEAGRQAPLKPHNWLPTANDNECVLNSCPAGACVRGNEVQEQDEGATKNADALPSSSNFEGDMSKYPTSYCYTGEKYGNQESNKESGESPSENDRSGKNNDGSNTNENSSNTPAATTAATSVTTNRSSNTNDNDNSVNDEDNNNNNNNNSHGITQVAVQHKQSSRALVEKLQEIYRNIVRQETELQECCSQLTTSQTTDLKNLWVIYKLNAELIDNYFMFITTALLPTQPEADLLIGQEIIEVYRIERRLWVYGTITFLDVLKNFSNFMDPEVCCQFIVYIFISISNMIGDIPPNFSIIWLERLGDLSRMAIALYPSGFIDWKLSAEYWYREALKYTFGHGKLYYHMSTVQQNTLAAFVNLGKSVFCHDTFIPSQQYMQLVIDNIYQRAFAERNSGHYRNSHLVEYLKHTEVMLLPSFLENLELQNVVLTFFEQKFGASSSYDFFDSKFMFIQDDERLKHYFRHAPLYAESHILQLVGFGDAKTPFALLFELPKYLKERKERKEKRKSKSSNSNQDISIEELLFIDPTHFFETIDSTKIAYKFPEDIAIWRESLRYVNLTSMRCSMVVLRKFLHGPFFTALPHLLPWAYFLVAVGMKLSDVGNEEVQRFWITLVRHIFPWESIVNFLNVLLLYLKSQYEISFPIDDFMAKYMDMPLKDLLKYFCENEDLPEVWNCWGTLWFDTINDKHSVQLANIRSTGVEDYMFLDAPIDGIVFDHSDESGEKFWKRGARIILLFCGIAREFSFGCIETSMSSQWSSLVFKYNELPESWKELYLGEFMEKYSLFEEISSANLDLNASPHTGMLPGFDIRLLQGYRTLLPDYACYNKNGDRATGSIYTSAGALLGSGLPVGDDLNSKRYMQNGQLVSSERSDYSNLVDREERPIIEEFLRKSYYKDDSHWERLLPRGDLQCFTDTHVTYFVLDATTWLRHFGHVYKLATNNLLKFAICLTTFQELRFLRKSKDESVLEAATRAVITVRQLYYERKLLPLRFTGNVAGHLEEHLEIEEQMTWRSHVDEFVIEAIDRAQEKFNQLNNDARAAGRDSILTAEHEKFNFISLITDDANMCSKAKAHNIKAFSTRFMFSVCNELGLYRKVCTN